MYRVYRRAHRLKIQRDNQSLWLQGLYIRDAVASLLAKDFKYPAEPYKILQPTKLEKKIEDRIAIEKMRSALGDIVKTIGNKGGAFE